VDLVALHLVGRPLVGLVVLGVRDPAGLVGPETLAVVDPAAPEDMNRVDPAVMEGMGRVDLASPGARVGLANPAVRARVALADMILEGPGDLGIQDRAERFMTAQDPQGRTAARVLSQDRARLALTPTLLDRTPGHLHRVPAVLDRTPGHLRRMPAVLDRTRRADRRWDPTTRAEATRPEARLRLAGATRPVAEIRQAEATRRVEETHPAEPGPSSRVRVACSAKLSGLARITDQERLRAGAFHIEGSWVISPDEENRTYRCDSSRHRQLRAGRCGRCN
jgi:hypothetical protein